MEDEARRALAALPAAVYTTDAEGRITFFNEAAAELWGHRPELGSAKWCGSWKLYFLDGRPMRHDQCPMAVALKEDRPVLGAEAIAERPDGSRLIFSPFPNTIRDANGKVVGAINLLVDITERKLAEDDAGRLAAIVSSSDDAIVSKTLEGVVTSWNDAAERIFGHTAQEMIGQSIRKIIPAHLQSEEDDILARLRGGERIDHFETQRQAKDGRLIDISITVSPVRDKKGVLVGASKVARDITEKKQNEKLQDLLFHELNHRVKNSLATIQALARQSMRQAADPRAFVESFTGRVQALARAHDLLVSRKMRGAGMKDLVREQVTLGSAEGSRIAISGPNVMLEARIAVQLALVLHELATNARKYGALSVPTGSLLIAWDLDFSAGRELRLSWKEGGVPNLSTPRARGFGSTLIERSLEANKGEASIRYGADGVTCEIRLPLPEEEKLVLAEPSKPGKKSDVWVRKGAIEGRSGRILVIEDEPLVAIEIEQELEAHDFAVVGPASHLESARRLIAEGRFDAALLDANLGGERVDDLAAALTRSGRPFAFLSGYGREALPATFREAELVSKPFDPDRLLAAVHGLLSRNEGASSNVTRLQPRA